MKKIVLTSLMLLIFAVPAWAVELDLYTMSQCPYGTEFENNLITLFDKFPELQDKVKVNINYIGEEKKSADGKTVFECLHGPAEVSENMRQLVIAKHWPDKLFAYLRIRNTDIRSPEWEAAAILAGLDPKEVKSKLNEPSRNRDFQSQAEELLSQSIAQSNKAEAKSSPTIYINNKLYQGGRGVPALLRVLARHSSLPVGDIGECGSDLDCQNEGKVGSCENPNSKYAKCVYKKAAGIKGTIITAKGKVFAELAPLKSWLKSIFPGVEINEIDIIDFLEPENKLLGSKNSRDSYFRSRDVQSQDPENLKALIHELDIDALPVFIFDQEIKNNPRFPGMKKQQIFVARKDKFLLAEKFVPPNFYFKRKRIPNELIIFAMSQCPYGIAAENALIDASADIKIHFVAEEKKEAVLRPSGKNNVLSLIEETSGFESLHGIAEVEEDLRQVCIMKYYPDKYFTYLAERNKNIKSSWWEDVAIASGIDGEKIKACAQGKEGKELLKENIRLTNLLSVPASPRFLWENQIRLNSVRELKKLPQFKGLKIENSDGSCQSN